MSKKWKRESITTWAAGTRRELSHKQSGMERTGTELNGIERNGTEQEPTKGWATNKTKRKANGNGSRPCVEPKGPSMSCATSRTERNGPQANQELRCKQNRTGGDAVNVISADAPWPLVYGARLGASSHIGGCGRRGKTGLVGASGCAFLSCCAPGVF